MRPTLRLLILCALAVAATLVVFIAVPFYPQDPAYHRFADARSIGPIPNGWNVLSNALLIPAGIYGLLAARRATFVDRTSRAAALVVFGGVVLTAFGSGYYHWSPNDGTLVWDRIGIAITLGGFLALMIADRVGRPDTPLLPVILAFAAVATVILWRVTGDLRAYGIAQFFPFVAAIVMYALFPGRYSHGWVVWIILGGYAVAKLCEDRDPAIYSAAGSVSGHTLKHVAAAGTATLIAWWIGTRSPLTADR